ncbi:MAG: SDR family oxidoreductase [Bacteroidetes bacterium]|nr:SDR family oxidoreductase [Bacteroidota bacterium]
MNNAFQLKDKLVWIVGGAGYLGQAVVTLINNLGAKVLCIDIENRAAEFVNSAKLSGKVAVASFNINDTGFIGQFVKEQAALHGSPDGLVNLAFGSTAKKMEELTDEDFDKVNHAALTATFMFAREVSNYMIKSGRGSIVLFSSMYGLVSPNDEIYEAPMNKNPLEYGVGKAGVIQMTKYLAVHWAKQQIRVNCISPGPFPNPSVQQNYPDFIARLTKKSPMGRIGIADEIAGPVAFLLSDLSGYVTGHNLVVDGGWTSW